jgi:hypothetical protein
LTEARTWWPFLHLTQFNRIGLNVRSALTQQLSVDKGIVVLPLLAADGEVPPLLREIRWIDFRENYYAGLNYLLDFFVNHAHWFMSTAKPL